jgi:hypothetical protein
VKHVAYVVLCLLACDVQVGELTWWLAAKDECQARFVPMEQEQ